MRVALVQCPPWGTLPPLGAATLKAYLTQQGHDAQCFDFNIDYCRERLHALVNDPDGSVYARPDPWASESYDDWLFDFDGEVQFKSGLKDQPLPVERWADQVLACSPQMVGFTVHLTSLGSALQLAQVIKRRDPSILLVFGGPHVAEDQQGGGALLTGVPHVVVEGEGEETLVELIEAVESGRDLGEIRGIARLVDGVPLWNERRPLMAHVDTLPFPDFSDFDWTQYPNPFEIPMMTSRGCVLNCAFCYETVYWKRYRTQSAERIAAEIQYQIARHPLKDDVDRGFRRFDISFADSLVNGHLGGLKRMSQILIETNTKTAWNGQATVNTKMDAEFFRLMADSGCTGLSFGLESGSQSVLDAMGKRFQIDDAHEFFRHVHAAGILLIVNIMVGFPTETRADFIETLRFLRRIRGLVYMVNNVSPMGVPPGSKVHVDPEKYGVQPADPIRWKEGHDLQWESPATGTHRDRRRRLRILHLWMRVNRVPHQRMVTPRISGRTRKRVEQQKIAVLQQNRLLEYRPPEPEPGPYVPSRETGISGLEGFSLTTSQVEHRLVELTTSLAEPPLVLTCTGEIIEGVAAAPDWARPVDPDTFIGHSVSEIPSRLAVVIGQELDVSISHDSDGVMECVATAPNEHGVDSQLTGVRSFVFPPPAGSLSYTIATFPTWARATTHSRAADPRLSVASEDPA